MGGRDRQRLDGAGSNRGRSRTADRLRQRRQSAPYARAGPHARTVDSQRTRRQPRPARGFRAHGKRAAVARRRGRRDRRRVVGRRGGAQRIAARHCPRALDRPGCESAGGGDRFCRAHLAAGRRDSGRSGGPSRSGVCPEERRAGHDFSAQPVATPRPGERDRLHGHSAGGDGSLRLEFRALEPGRSRVRSIAAARADVGRRPGRDDCGLRGSDESDSRRRQRRRRDRRLPPLIAAGFEGGSSATRLRRPDAPEGAFVLSNSTG